MLEPLLALFPDLRTNYDFTLKKPRLRGVLDMIGSKISQQLIQNKRALG